MEHPERTPRFFAKRRSGFFQDIWPDLPYDLPGGLVNEESDRNIAEAAAREVGEELETEVAIDVEPSTGDPIILDTDEILLKFMRGREVVDVDLTRYVVGGQAFTENLGNSEEHAPGSGLWLPFDGLIQLDFDPRMKDSLLRIGGGIAVAQMVERPRG